MHTAYNINHPKNLSFVIESMRAFGDNLIVGTKQGHLLMYRNVTGSESNGGTGGIIGSALSVGSPSELKLVLLKTNKSFKKPILQLEVVPELSLLAVLSDGAVTVHDIDLSTSNFPIVTTVARGGCCAFALDVLKQRSLTGELSVTLRLAVAARKKLLLFYWKNRRFNELVPEIALADVPRSVAWCRRSICVGFRYEYVIVKLANDSVAAKKEEAAAAATTTTTSSSGHQDPRVCVLPEREAFALSKDDRTTVMVDLDGEPSSSSSSLSWPQPSRAVAWDTPYLLSLQPNGVAVKSLELQNEVVVQTMSLTSKPRLVCSAGGNVYVASASHLWFLKMVSVPRQVEQLVTDKQFELAIALLESSSSSSEGGATKAAKKRVLEVKILQAFDLFCSRRFRPALDLLFELNADTSHVIGLYGDLLPKDYQETLDYPSRPPVLSGEEATEALRDLIEYLTRVRQRVKKRGGGGDDQAAVPIARGCSVVKASKGVCEIVDTTLVKCYLRIEDRHPLLAPLLRLPDNQCHLKETEAALKRHGKVDELATFYATRGLHRRALEMLSSSRRRREEEEEEEEVGGIAAAAAAGRTVRYLHNLRAEDVELACEYTAPLLDADPDIGLAVFAADVANVEEWPREKVLDFLSATCGGIVDRYLEFVVDVWGETNPLFHNALVVRYKDMIVEGGADAEAARGKLRRFLEASTRYLADVVLPQFPADDRRFDEERAMLLGSLGRHEEALALHLRKMRDADGALRYCARHFVEGGGGADVYSTLYRLMAEDDVDSALKLLEMHGDRIDAEAVVEATPAWVPLGRVAPFVTSALEKRVARSHHARLTRALMHAEHLQVQEERIHAESQKVTLTESDVCRVCGRRFRSQVAFVRLRTGQIIHYSCKDRAAAVV